jgi:hypothetical protein
MLELERQRSQRSKRPVLLVLVALRDPHGPASRIDSNTATLLFRVLLRSLRETDLVGWFQERKVIGAVVVASPGAPGTDTSGLVSGKVRRALGESLPPRVSSRLRLRVRKLPSRSDAGWQ